MPAVTFKPIAYSPRITIAEVIREVNQELQRVANLSTANFRVSYPQVDAVVLSNTTLPIWLPLEAYEVDSIMIRTSAGTASATPRIDTVNMGVAGGVPISVTTTPTLYAVTSANAVAALSTVDLVVTGLGAGQWLTASLGVRRVA